jgi:PAS domain-containing protein
MRLALKAYLKSLASEYPNSLDVRQFQAMYKSIISSNSMSQKVKAPKVTGSASSWSQVTHLGCLSIFPKFQHKVFGRLLKFQEDSGRHHIAQVHSQDFVPVRGDREHGKSVKKSKQKFSERRPGGSWWALACGSVGLLFCSLFVALSIKMESDYEEIVGRMGRTNDNFVNCLFACHEFMVGMVGDIHMRFVPKTTFDSRDRFLDESLKFGNDIRLDSLENKVFNESYFWMTSFIVDLPSYDGAEVPAQFLSYLRRCAVLFDNICSDDACDLNVPEVLIFVLTTHRSPAFFDICVERLRATNQVMEDYWRATAYARMMIPWAIVAGVMFALVIALYIRELKAFIAYWDGEDKKSCVYSPPNFWSFRVVLFVYTIGSLTVIFLPFGASYVVSGVLGRYGRDVKHLYDGLLNLAQMFIDLAAPLLYVQLSHRDAVPQHLLTDQLWKWIGYFYRGYEENLSYSHMSNTFFLLAEGLKAQIVGNEVRYNAELFEKIYEMFRGSILPHMLSLRSELSRELQSTTELMRIRVSSVHIVAGVVLSIAILNIILIVRYFGQTLSTFSHFVRYRAFRIANESERAKKKANKIIERIRSPARNVLDYYDHPAAMLTKSKCITWANMGFFDYFGLKSDCVLGLPITNFVEEGDPDYAITPVDDSGYLFVLHRRRRTEFLRKRLVKAERLANEWRRVFVPKRFLNHFDRTWKIRFIVSASVVFAPGKKDDVSPNDWTKDMNYINEFLETRTDEDVDILRESGREVTILFGVNEVNDPDVLVLKSMVLLTDLLRVALEGNCSAESVVCCITVACGCGAQFTVGGNMTTRMEMNGAVFDCQMDLRKRMQPNAIVLSGEMNQRLKVLKCGFAAAEIDEGAFLFMGNIGI